MLLTLLAATLSAQPKPPAAQGLPPLTKKVEAASAGAPKPAVDLKPGRYNYRVKIAMGAKEVSLKSSTSIKEENGAWTATDNVESDMAAATDTTTLEKGTLIVRKRSAKQGPMAIDVAFAGGKATGKMTMNGQEHPVDAELGGTLFADGGGAFQAISCLPLAAGYSTTYRNFDLQKQKVKVMRLQVAGAEGVTVPAGKFNTYKVEIASADGGNDQIALWIAKGTRQVVKISAVMASMGGATMTSELMP